MQSEVEKLVERLRNYRPPVADGYGYPVSEVPREHHPICDEAASLIERLYRERESEAETHELWWVVAWHDEDLTPEYLAGPWYNKEHAAYQAQKCVGRTDDPRARVGLLSSAVTQIAIDSASRALAEQPQ